MHVLTGSSRQWQWHWRHHGRNRGCTCTPSWSARGRQNNCTLALHFWLMCRSHATRILWTVSINMVCVAYNGMSS
eukprot:m.161005 g.161005  ORF g.161005 m.161005 type:complete len:75 (-) comp12017_c0_seq1:1563-1787(-)